MEISAGGLAGTNQKCGHHCLLLRPVGLQGQRHSVCRDRDRDTRRIPGNTQVIRYSHSL